MHKKKFTEEQTELLALLPQGLPKMTDGAKLVLAQIIMLYGTDFAKANGYVFRSTDDMLKDTEISSKTTLSRANRQLTQLGLMTVKSGSYESRTANEYRLSDEMLEKIGFNQSVLMGTHMGTHMGTLSSDMGTLCENEAIKQLVEQNKSLMLMVNELSKQVKCLSEQVESITKNSKCTTETDTESEKEKNTCSYSTWTHEEKRNCQVQVEESISVETVKASAPKDSSSLIEEEMASAYEASANEHISADEDELISTVVNDSVGYEDAKVTSTDEETISEADIISVDGNSTSTELYPWDVVDVTSTEDELTDEADLTSVDSSKGDLNLTDRFTLSQLEDKNPPQVPLVPPLTEFKDNVMKAILKGVYDWSLTLENVPKYITHDDYNPIVIDALRAQPDHERYMGAFPLSDLDLYAKELMENRIKNRDIPAIVSENQYRIRHEAAIKELMGN